MTKPLLAIVEGNTALSDHVSTFSLRRGLALTRLPSIAHARHWLQQQRIDLLLLDGDAERVAAMELINSMAGRADARIVLLATEAQMPKWRGLAGDSVELLQASLPWPQIDAELEQVLHRLPPRRGKARFGLVGECAAIARVQSDIARVAPLDISVLIAGETGTGKELLAKAIHDASGRSGRLVAVNCGAIPPELLASQLFGHERGSFTGANQRHAGYFEQAQGGTLFLDEIGEMAPELQVYLLRCLETGAITRVGSDAEVKLDVRIVAATHRDLLGSASTLRRDLYYRLSHYVIELPPLRERGDDVHLIADALLDTLNRRYGTRKQFDAFSRTVLAQHRWPGNVRELSSAVARSYYRADGDAVTVEPLLQGEAASPARETHGQYATTGDEVTFRVGTPLKQIEQEMLARTLHVNGGDKSAAARSLGISVRTIYNLMSRSDRDFR
ncbi:sigma-54 dependent transcriptional regulator [Xanthomonas sp. CFBP 8445]|uniref:sigma 54-interacting transcriptional regulator n=1 Tax=Xanthomonas sp. CFBP 8445 TaxID=2971236 RepID=UPI0021DFC9EF|nr:sigma-54 dependent transcriptional regulator [Xanthomonas sp. CFBP 8445]UYC10525.1 sigma-54 dependent transcriptional regulator [Xanthomonas sp. CFBP 8445]